ncbi:MAG TPA: hypothetical protein VNP36_15770 [Burkholderiales bacterium]|nr:hypothetical protein [Burkholderiales bacterium]
MRNKLLWFSAAVLLMVSGSAAADRWVIEAGSLYLEQPGKARRAVELPGWHWAGEPYACAPDIAVGPRGEVVVTSNVLPVLWKIDPQTLAVSVHPLQLDADSDKDVGFSGLVYSERNGAYFAVSGLHGTLWRIDPLLRRAQKIALAEPVRGACSLSMQRQERTSRFSRLCLDGKNVNLAPDQRSAYVQTADCSPDEFVLIGGKK